MSPQSTGGSLSTMRWPWSRSEQLPSEGGFLHITRGETGLPLHEAFRHFRELISEDMDWADSRKARARWRASLFRILAVMLGSAATVVIGWPAADPDAPKKLALILTATVTALGALDLFFGSRSRWELAAETKYRLNRIRDELDYYLVTTPRHELDKQELDKFYHQQQALWADVSTRWIARERAEQTTSQPSDLGEGPSSRGNDLA